MEQLLSAKGFMRYVLLLAILDNMANRAKLTGLASRHDGLKIPSGVSSDRVTRVREYVFKRFRQKISLEEIAGVAHLSPHSFCRFFKNSTGKTFARFVLEVRIGHACTLLAGGKKSLKAISRESGFNNMTCFYKYFKAITGMTPGQYNRLSAPASLHGSHSPAYGII